jgi:hypothetical protein
MTEYVGTIEVWFEADSEAQANERLAAFAAHLEHPPVKSAQPGAHAEEL